MQYDALIKNGTIVTAADIYTADIGIKDEKIVAIAANLNTSTTKQVLDAAGKYVFPGGIDVHTHLSLPVAGTRSKDDFTTGTIAAACGGTTTIIDFCTPEKGQNLATSLQLRQHEAMNHVVIDYGLHMSIVEATPAILNEMQDMLTAGLPTFKLYMTYDALRLEDDDLLRVLLRIREIGGLACVHAENYHVIKYLTQHLKETGKNAPFYHHLAKPPLAEAEATNRIISLAMLADAPLYVVHVTCEQSLAALRQARKQNVKVMGETCPQYLLLSQDIYQKDDFTTSAKYVLSPPLRPKENQNILWQALHDNVLQVVSTDHCPFDFDGQKTMGRNFFGDIPNGIAGIECRMALIFDRGVNAGKISLNEFVAITATNPAKIFGMYPQKGSITINADADLVIFDPTLRKTITKTMLHENVDYTPYEGFTVTGYPVTTLSRGKIVAENGKFVGEIGAGKFLRRAKPLIL